MSSGGGLETVRAHVTSERDELSVIMTTSSTVDRQQVSEYQGF